MEGGRTWGSKVDCYTFSNVLRSFETQLIRPYGESFFPDDVERSQAEKMGRLVEV